MSPCVTNRGLLDALGFQVLLAVQGPVVEDHLAEAAVIAGGGEEAAKQGLAPDPYAAGNHVGMRTYELAGADRARVLSILRDLQHEGVIGGVSALIAVLHTGGDGLILRPTLHVSRDNGRVGNNRPGGV